jgi:hypothetical protein
MRLAAEARTNIFSPRHASENRQLAAGATDKMAEQREGLKTLPYALSGKDAAGTAAVGISTVILAP